MATQRLRLEGGLVAHVQSSVGIPSRAVLATLPSPKVPCSKISAVDSPKALSASRRLVWLRAAPASVGTTLKSTSSDSGRAPHRLLTGHVPPQKTKRKFAIRRRLDDQAHRLQDVVVLLLA